MTEKQPASEWLRNARGAKSLWKLVPSQARTNFKKGLLDDFGWRLPAPHAKHIGNDIYELRFQGVVGQLRILYFFFTGNKIIFTNSFVKKTDKTPKNEITMALDRKKDFLNRMKESDEDKKAKNVKSERTLERGDEKACF